MLRFQGAPSIRTTLALLVVACVLPLAVMAGLLVSSFYAHERRQLSSNSIVQAHGIVSAVDREIAATQAALLALSTSHRLATGDLAGFYKRATDSLPILRADSVIVIDKTGQILLSTRVPFGYPLPRVPDPELLRRILATGKPGVSDLFMGPLVQQQIYTVGVPVRIEGDIVYSLNATFTPRRLVDLLRERGLPSTWRVGVTDSAGKLVARSHDIEKFLGRSMMPDVLMAMRTSNEGSLESTTLDGIPVLTAFSKSPVTRWGAAVGIPRAELTAGLHKTLFWLVVATISALGTGLWLAWLLGGRIARSITALTQPAIDLASGARLAIPRLHFKEANAMRQALLHAAVTVRQSRHDAHHDGLTGLPNRTLFHHFVAQQIALCQRNSTELCILFIDLDGFKAVNDTFGHAAGDQLLREVSKRIAGACRGSDITARLGGDEFAVALINTDLERSRVFATKLVETISQPYVFGDFQAEVSASIGIANFPNTATDGDTLLRKADHAMYMAKSTGKRRVCVAA